jgi:16S rRNA (guanine527-N7)-methyltransferase
LNDTRGPDSRLAELLCWAGAQGIDLDPRQQHQLSAYLETLLHWNRRVDLVSQSDPQVIITKHFADCLIPARFCPAAARITDLGSGAGFPGLVLAIALPRATVSAVESRGKRASFLAEAVRIARIDNAVVVHGRAESLTDRCRSDVVISRALAPLRSFLPLARPLLRPSGIALAMKGPRFADETDECAKLGYSIELCHRYRLPDESDRILLGLRCA